MGRMTVTLDEELVEEAREALGAKSRAEAIRRALYEVSRRHRLQEALRKRGKVALEVDQETLQRLRREG